MLDCTYALEMAHWRSGASIREQVQLMMMDDGMMHKKWALGLDLDELWVLLACMMIVVPLYSSWSS